MASLSRVYSVYESRRSYCFEIVSYINKVDILSSLHIFSKFLRPYFVKYLLYYVLKKITIIKQNPNANLDCGKE